MNRIYSHNSLTRLETCHPDLQRVFTKALEIMDHSILEGRRGKEDQDKAFETGKSKLKWPNGKHNTVSQDGLSDAVDAAPFPIDFNDIPRQCYFAGLILGIAHAYGITLRWGGDWNMDGIVLKDQDFDDLVHFERTT